MHILAGFFGGICARSALRDFCCCASSRFIVYKQCRRCRDKASATKRRRRVASARPCTPRIAGNLQQHPVLNTWPLYCRSTPLSTSAHPAPPAPCAPHGAHQRLQSWIRSSESLTAPLSPRRRRRVPLVAGPHSDALCAPQPSCPCPMLTAASLALAQGGRLACGLRASSLSQTRP